MTLFSRATYIGIDPSGGRYGIAYAAIDEALKVMTLGGGGLDEVAAFLGGKAEATVAINAPPRPNQRVLADRGLREQISPAFEIPQLRDYRLAEYQLAQHDLRIYHTPEKQADCPAWMRRGFGLHRRLGELGFEAYAADGGEKRVLEASPYVNYCTWLGHKPFRKHSLEGRLQRQLALFERGVALPDPMRFFEEITRHRMLQGELPEDIPYQTGELEALANAYAAWLAVHQADEVSWVGDAEEGQILVPVKELKPVY